MTADLLVMFTLRASLLLALALLIAWATERRPAAWRRQVLAAAICGALSMPVLHVLLPTWHVPVPSLRGAGPPRAPAVAEGTVVVETTLIAPAPAAADSSTTSRAASPLRQWLVGLWLAGVAACALPLLAGLVRLRLLLARSASITDGRWHRGWPGWPAATPGCGARL